MKFDFYRWLTVGTIALSAIACPKIAHAGLLVNPSFESPVLSPPLPTFALLPSIPGWQTTDTAIEIWTNGFLGVPAIDGNQFAEINANNVGTLFQEVSGIAANSQVGFTFLHRARQGIDTLLLTITDLGSGNILGGGDDTVLFTQQYSATTAAWVPNIGVVPTLTLGNTIRVAFTAVSTGSGDNSVGNFLDAADLNVVGGGGGGGTTGVPEPSSILGILTVGVAGVVSSRKRGKKKN